VLFWSSIAQLYKYNNRVIYSLLSNPTFRSTERWIEFVNAAITRIRETGSVNLILVEGNHASDIKFWNSSDEFGVANTEAMLRIQDPFDRVAIEVNIEYPASYETGLLEDGVLSEFEHLRRISEWLDENHRVGFLSEYASVECDAQLAVALRHLERNRNLWLGWSWDTTKAEERTQIADVLEKVMLRAEELDMIVFENEALEESRSEASKLLKSTISPLLNGISPKRGFVHCYYACTADSASRGALSRFVESVRGIGLLTAVFILLALLIHP